MAGLPLGFDWGKRFGKPRARAHAIEDVKLLTTNDDDLVTKFLESRATPLEPPDYTCSTLKKFLSSDKFSNIYALNASRSKNIIVDDRRDPTEIARRDLDSETYLTNAHEGTDKWYSALDDLGAYERLKENAHSIQRSFDEHNPTIQWNRAERRIIYVAGLTALCALLLAKTVSEKHAYLLKYFLQRHLVNRIYLGVSMQHDFWFELQLPYYAIRRSSNEDPRGFRKSEPLFPLRDVVGHRPWIHQCQISLLVIGLDEWYWTAYCCVDTYFGHEETTDKYQSGSRDAPTGGNAIKRRRDCTIWDPREYVLIVLWIRMEQIRKEWENIICFFEEELVSYELLFFDERKLDEYLSEDKDFRRTKEFAWAAYVLRLLRDSLSNLIQTWEDFQSRELQYYFLNTVKSEAISSGWRNWVTNIEQDVSQLKHFRSCLSQKIDLIDTLKSGYAHALMLRETKAATRQGDLVTTLNRITVLYLPPSLVTSIFNMAATQSRASWFAYVPVLVVAYYITMWVVQQG